MHAEYDYVCANLDFDDEQINSKIKDYEIYDIADLKVGVFGLITPDLFRVCSPGSSVHIETDIIPLAKDVVAELEGKDCDVIVATTHLGFKLDSLLAVNVDGIDFITGAFLDITERKVAEKALHESEEKYRSLFASGPNPIFVLDRQTLEILDANPSAEEAYGYSKEDLVRIPFTELGAFECEEYSLGQPGPGGWPDDLVEGQNVRH